MAEAVMNEFRIFEFQYDVIVAANARRRKAPTTKMGACFWWRSSRLFALIKYLQKSTDGWSRGAMVDSLDIILSAAF